MTTLVDRLSALWEAERSGVAIHHDGRPWTWGDVTDAADAAMRLVGAAGLDANLPLVVALENEPTTVAAVAGGIASGRRLRFVNAMLSRERLCADLAGLRPAVLLGTQAVIDKLDDEDHGRVVLLTPGSSPRIVMDREVPEVVSRPEVGDFRGALEMFTSGTTGPAKRVTITAAQVEASLGSTLKHFVGRTDAAARSGSRSPAIVSTPISHIGGLFGVLQSLATQRPFVLMDRWRLDPWLDVVRTHRPKICGLPPAAIRTVLDADVPREDLASLLSINAGTAPLDPQLADDFYAAYGIPILNVYGATEFAGAVAGWTLPMFHEWWSAKKGSVGRPQPGVDMRVVDADGAELAAGAAGRLQIRTPQASTDGWIMTSDKARLDADGFLWIDGRADDVIIRGGFKIDPLVVCRVIEAFPGVIEAAVVAKADSRLGHVPVAAVQMADAVDHPSSEDLRDHCRQTLTGYEVPADFRVVAELPRGASMKVSAVDVLALFDESGVPAA